MNILSNGYGINPKSVWTDERIGVYAKAVISYFLSYTGAGKIECWPSMETIAKHVGISENTARKAIAELETIGWVESGKLSDNPMNHQKKYILTIIENAQDAGSYLTGCVPDTSPRAFTEPHHRPISSIVEHEHNNNNNNHEHEQHAPSAQLSPPHALAPQMTCVGGVYRITSDHVQKLEDLYTHLDIMAELKKAAMWLEANPSRRKTPKGMPRFINAWMERSQNSSRGQQSFTPNHGKRTLSQAAQEAYDLLDPKYKAMGQIS